MSNATHALNTALWGCVRRGERVVITAFDHNAVLRTAAHLRTERAVDVTLIAGAGDGAIDEDALVRALDGAKLLSLNAASNVLGTRLDIARLAALARAAGALSVVDLAQLAGHAPFDAAECGADMVAFTGHKGLLGPQGVGALWVREGVDIDPFMTGGTGGDSMLREMPPAYPDHLEAGTLNGPGIAGLHAGAEFLLHDDVAAIHSRTMTLKRSLYDGLASVGGIRVVSPPAPDGVAIVTIVSQKHDPATLAARLDREHAVLTRPGLHCAPEAHRVLGTERTGAVRFSLGYASTDADVRRAVEAVDRVTRAA
jgi:selenocysteine lyase/cysteine desulfurase